MLDSQSSPPPTTDLPPFSEDSDFEVNELPSEYQDLPDDDELEDDEGVDLFGENMEKYVNFNILIN